MLRFLRIARLAVIDAVELPGDHAGRFATGDEARQHQEKRHHHEQEEGGGGGVIEHGLHRGAQARQRDVHHVEADRGDVVESGARLEPLQVRRVIEVERQAGKFLVHFLGKTLRHRQIGIRKLRKDHVGAGFFHRVGSFEEVILVVWINGALSRDDTKVPGDFSLADGDAVIRQLAFPRHQLVWRLDAVDALDVGKSLDAVDQLLRGFVPHKSVNRTAFAMNWLNTDVEFGGDLNQFMEFGV